jgi:tetratricopeptide (TPR) repeat protein
VLAVASLGGGWFAWGWVTAPAPPAVSYADVDPAVAAAIEAARREVWWKPHSAAAWGRLGLLLRAHGVRPEANRCFAQAEQLAADDPRWPYLQGYALRLDDPEAAVRHLQRAVALCGTSPDAPALTLADVFAQQGRFDDAEGQCRRVLQNDSENPRAHLGLGRLALERDNPRAALPHLRRAADGESTRKAAAVGLARAYHQLGDPTAAAAARARAAELPNDRPWPNPFLDEMPLLLGKQARLARLKSLHQQGRTAEMRELARLIEDDYPDVYWLVEGRQQMDLGQLSAAEQALRKAAELAPASVEAHFDLGTVLYRRKDYGAAAASFRTVTELQPDYGPAYLGLGRCRAAQGDRAAADRAFRDAVRLMPQSAEAHRELGGWLAREGWADEAAVHLRQSLQLNPQDAQARRLLEDVSRRAP